MEGVWVWMVICTYMKWSVPAPAVTKFSISLSLMARQSIQKVANAGSEEYTPIPHPIHNHETLQEAMSSRGAVRGDVRERVLEAVEVRSWDNYRDAYVWFNHFSGSIL